MTAPLADIIAWDGLAKLVIAGFAAGVGVSAIFGIALNGVARAVDMSRDGRSVAAAAFAALAAVALAAVAASIAYGLYVMVTR